MSVLATIGLGLHAVLLVGLTAVCAFDDGQLAPDASDCVIPLAMVLVPLILAVVGVARRSVGPLLAAAGLGLVVALISLTGPGLFVLVPAILYGVAAARDLPSEGREDLS